MNYSSGEIEELRKRLKAVEHAIDELRNEDLIIVKMIGRALCAMSLNVVARTIKAEEVKSFEKFWDKRLDAVTNEIGDSQTVESVFDIAHKFDTELADYVRATKVDTADKAMEIAHSFIKKYSPVALPLKALREDDVWLVDIDVGALAVKIANVKVDAKTGDILSYEIPERTEKK